MYYYCHDSCNCPVLSKMQCESFMTQDINQTCTNWIKTLVYIYQPSYHKPLMIPTIINFLLKLYIKICRCNPTGQFSVIFLLHMH